MVIFVCSFPPPWLSSPLTSLCFPSFLSVLPPLVFFTAYFLPLCAAAVQEERQRNKERDGEVESTSAVNEEMPVEKILEAEMAVEQKTELHADGTSGGSSVSLCCLLW